MPDTKIREWNDKPLTELCQHFSFERKGNRIFFIMHDLKLKEGDEVALLLPRFREVQIVIGRHPDRFIGYYTPPLLERWGRGGTMSEHILDSGIGTSGDNNEFEVQLYVFKNLKRMPAKYIEHWVMEGVEKHKQYSKYCVYNNNKLIIPVNDD